MLQIILKIQAQTKPKLFEIMGSNDWNFTAYLVSLSKSVGLENSNTEHHRCLVGGEGGTESVFAELKPAFQLHDSSYNDQQDNTKQVVRFIAVGPGYCEDGPDVLCTERNPCKHELDCRENIVEQPLISWDLNRLTVFGSDAIVGDITEESGYNVTSECQEHGGAVGKTTPGGFVPENTYYHPKNDEEIEEEFKFPKCIEEQFREMMLRNRRENQWHCNNCGSCVVQEGRSDPQTNHCQQVNDRKDLCNNNNEINCVQGNSLGNLNDGSDQQMGPNVDRIVTTNEEKRSETRVGDERKQIVNTAAGQEAATEIEEQCIDKLLTFINPEIDVMGKTFHNIPSTQPIYSDNEARDGANGDVARVRRPMNAFMLWARKYRQVQNY